MHGATRNLYLYLLRVCMDHVFSWHVTDLCNHVNNKISHKCKAKVTSHGRSCTSYKNATPGGNSTSHLLEIP